MAKWHPEIKPRQPVKHVFREKSLKTLQDRLESLPSERRIRYLGNLGQKISNGTTVIETESMKGKLVSVFSQYGLENGAQTVRQALTLNEVFEAWKTRWVRPDEEARGGQFIAESKLDQKYIQYTQKIFLKWWDEKWWNSDDPYKIVYDAFDLGELLTPREVFSESVRQLLKLDGPFSMNAFNLGYDQSVAQLKTAIWEHDIDQMIKAETAQCYEEIMTKFLTPAYKKAFKAYRANPSLETAEKYMEAVQSVILEVKRAEFYANNEADKIWEQLPNKTMKQKHYRVYHLPPHKDYNRALRKFLEEVYQDAKSHSGFPKIEILTNGRRQADSRPQIEIEARILKQYQAIDTRFELHAKEERARTWYGFDYF